MSPNTPNSDASAEHGAGEYTLTFWQQIKFVWRMFRDFIKEA